MSKLFCQPCAVANSPLRIDYVPIRDFLLNVGFSILLSISRYRVSLFHPDPDRRMLWVQFDKPTATAVSEWVLSKNGAPLGTPKSHGVVSKFMSRAHGHRFFTVVVFTQTQVTSPGATKSKRSGSSRRKGSRVFGHLSICKLEAKMGYIQKWRI